MGKNNYRLVKLVLTVMLLISSKEIYAGEAVNFSILSGNKSFESQTESGLIVEMQAPKWSVALVTSTLFSKKSVDVSDVKITGRTMEFGIGVRKYLIKKRMGFFVEGGLAWIEAKAKFETPEESISISDSVTGFWYGAGADIMIGDLLSVGLIGRISGVTAVATADDSRLEFGGRHFSIFAAYHF